MNTVVKVNNLFKRFLIGTNERLTLFQTLRYKLSGENPARELWALQNINLELKKGEMLAIIGPNGSGKTTLLKILAGIIKPTFGNFSIEGNVSTIFELGLGFNPRFTALDNIYMYGALHGITKKDINKKLDAILDFAELKDFVGAKINDFSSGMRARLAFATVIQTVQDIILVDEVLTVGDLAFQKKCVNIFEKLLNNGHTILFVSHGIGEAKRICSKALYLDKGKQIGFGNLNDLEQLYNKAVLENKINTTIQTIEIKNVIDNRQLDKKNINLIVFFKQIQDTLLNILKKIKNVWKKDVLFFVSGFLLPFIIIIIGLLIDYLPSIKQKINEQNQKKLYEKAIMLKNKGEIDKAIEMLNEYLKHNINSTSANIAIFEILLEKQNYTEALEIAQRLVNDIEPNNLWLIKTIANLYFEKNKFDFAIEFYIKMLMLSKEQNNIEEIKNAYLSIVRTYIELNNKKLAKQYSNEAKKIFPELKNITDELLFQTRYSE